FCSGVCARALAATAAAPAVARRLSAARRPILAIGSSISCVWVVPILILNLILIPILIPSISVGIKNKSRNRNKSESDIPFPKFLFDVIRGAPREREDRERRVLVRVGHERAAVGDEEILHFPRLAPL